MRGLALKNPADRRQVALVGIYLGLLAAMFLVPACRNAPFFVLACAFSFLNTVVIHNCLHQGIFVSARANMLWRLVLSFGALYPASANIPSHNLVHHHFDDDGQPDWADPHHVRFPWNLANLVHFPNVAGPNTFAGVSKWARLRGRGDFRAQYVREQVVAFGATAALMVVDFWTTLFFIVLPQLYGARCILRINLIQHDGCDTSAEWNHSRNFVGRFFNWIMCNNGFHTIHHNRAGLHWSELRARHDAEVVPRIDPALNEPSMVWYLFRTYVLHLARPAARDVAAAERAAPELAIATRAERRDAVEREDAVA